jgi:epoxyqueuosine reductase
MLLDGARSAISVALNYYQASEQVRPGADARGIFSLYAQGQDYHGVMKEKLATLDRRLRALYPNMKSVACADTKPISDRTTALMAGIAWLGKNTSVISPEFGSWIFIGELVTDLDLRPDTPLKTLCGSCSLCIDVCPTGALAEPFLVDARRCVSYLTVEKRGDIPADLHKGIGLNVFGCDACQSACPYNDAAKNSDVFDRKKGSPLMGKPLDDLAAISNGRFRELTENSAIRRCGPDGLRRNAEIARFNLTEERTARSEEKPKK